MCTDAVNRQEQNEIFEALKYLKPHEVSNLKKLILNKENKASKEKYIDFIAESSEYADNCPHCKSNSIVKCGKNQCKKQRFKCKVCGRSFITATNSPLMYTKKSTEHWLRYMQCMCNSLSVRASAKVVGIHFNTAFHWRHKILNALKAVLKNNLSGTIEIDETLINESFKGNHSKNEFFRMGRAARKRGVRLSECTSSVKVRILCCLDRENNIFSQVSGKLRPDWQKLMSMLKDNIPEGSTVCTNSNLAYVTVAKKLNFKLYKLKYYNQVVEEVYHIQNARSFGFSLKKFITAFNGVATKYLNFYITWLKWLRMCKEQMEQLKAIDMLLIVIFSKIRLRVCDLKLITSIPDESCPCA